MVSYKGARKIKDDTVTSKLYPLERSLGCAGCGNSRCQVCRNLMATDTFDSFTTKKAKTTSAVMINASSTFLVVRHVISNVSKTTDRFR